ncbi:NAD(P)-binding protein [Suillus clintonianus]|uniref:NAD(P)-binding protein n=1 Tax=Suillus clintonianus TaxID=1904413 RepID=UPI001B8756C8|nr:NAD(P)-binding protein [Suillus clintonianus]KAG2131785.1 NAD(P)-binding protein [Suillus clintonianus]
MTSSTSASIHTNPAALFGVEGQVAVVTGGGTGIGLMIATALENNGATVYIIGRRLEVIEKAAKENNKFGKLIPLQGDITCRQSLTELVEIVRTRHGYIDLLVNNAGIARNILPSQLPSPLDDPAHAPPSIKAFQSVLWDTGSPEGFAETFDTNVTAVYFTTVAFLELLHLGNLRRGDLPPVMSLRPQVFNTEASASEASNGRDSASSSPSVAYHSLPPTPSPITSLPAGLSSTNSAHALGIPQPTSQVITISSSGAFRLDARVLSISYTMAKNACTHLGRLLANLLSDWGIRSNVLCPGVFPSEMTSTQHLTPALLAQAVPLGRAGVLSDISGPILFLAGPAGAYVNGAVWLVDGGRVGSVASSYQ